MNEMIIALTILLAAILIVNIMNPEVRYWILRFILRDKTDAVEKALFTGIFPNEMQYKTVMIHGVYIGTALGGKIYEHDDDTAVVEFTDEKISGWIESIFSFPFWFGSRRLRLGRNFYHVLTISRNDNKLKMFISRSKPLQKTFRTVVILQTLVTLGVFAFLIHGAYRFNDPTMIVPAIYAATIVLIISAFSFFIRGSK